MRTTTLLLAVFTITSTLSCKRDPAVKAATAASEPPASGSPSSDTDDIGPAKYAQCKGQGGHPNQLAPAFLDQMEACEQADTAAADALSNLAGDGMIIPGKGDCQFAGGITCHFHTSMEFVRTGRLNDDERRVGELHCIVPSDNPSSPSVYGAHVRCKPGTTAASGTKACSKQLLQALDRDHCREPWKCCDNGTLTKPVAKQAPAELQLRPDFRICTDDAIEVDCGLFHGMHGHTANVVGLGEEITGLFNASEAHAKAP